MKKNTYIETDFWIIALVFVGLFMLGYIIAQYHYAVDYSNECNEKIVENVKTFAGNRPTDDFVFDLMQEKNDSIRWDAWQKN